MQKKCVTCKAEFEDKERSPVCVPCWRKLPKPLRLEFIEARNEMEKTFRTAKISRLQKLNATLREIVGRMASNGQ